MFLRFFLVLALFLGLALPLNASDDRLPHTMIWAWQRPEDLSFIDPREMGVAYLACHVVISGERVQLHWRDQPLQVPPATIMEPVVRVDVDSKRTAAFSAEQCDQIVDVVRKVSTLPRSAAVQIDFDALQDQRAFYRELLQKIHARYPGLRLSMTALTSWCLFDSWIKDLPVDETVPMLFSLGRDRSKILLYFRTNNDFLVENCRSSLGLSLEDAEVNRLMIPRAKQRTIPVRFYVFSRTAWSKSKIDAVQKLLSQ